MVSLNLGCGRDYRANAINVDYNRAVRADLYCDFTEGLPFAADSVDCAHLDNVLEHVARDAYLALLEELHRVCRPGATIYIHVPHASGVFALTHPTHYSYFGVGSFDTFTPEEGFNGERYSDARFIIRREHLYFFHHNLVTMPWLSALPINGIFNFGRMWKRAMERFQVFGFDEIYYELEVYKGDTVSAKSEEMTRRRVPMALFVVVGLLLYGGIVYWLGWGEVWAALEAVHWGLFGMLSVVMTGVLWLRVLKWKLALPDSQGVALAFFVSKFAGNWSPGRVGELAPLLSRAYRTPKMAAWIVVDRLLELGATLLLGMAGLLAFRMPHTGLFLGLLAVGCVGLYLAFVLLAREGFYLGLRVRFPEASRRAAWLGRAASISREVERFRGLMPWALAMTVLAKTVDLLAVMLLFRCFGFEVGFALVAVVRCAAALIGAVPFTPDASGVPLLATAALLYRYGGITKEALAAAIPLELALLNLLIWVSLLAVKAGLERGK